ncbi:SLC25A17 [Symbiodinium sp. CCMP2592]|nr:SLC25A17 [Symbiodinium sp. CCMP2592]
MRKTLLPALLAVAVVLLGPVSMVYAFWPLAASAHQVGRSKLALRASGDQKGGTVYVCTGPSCRNDGAEGCLQLLRSAAPEGVQVKETGCLGPCSSGPNVLATPRPANDPLGGKGREARNVGGVQQPAGVCFTGIKAEEDVALLSEWGFQADASSNPLSALRLLVRSTGADQVPWPILLYAACPNLWPLLGLRQRPQFVLSTGMLELRSGSTWSGCPLT